MIKERISKLRGKFNEFNIDGYVIPKNDEFFSEYTQKDRLKTISNFTGQSLYHWDALLGTVNTQFAAYLCWLGYRLDVRILGSPS